MNPVLVIFYKCVYEHLYGTHDLIIPGIGVCTLPLKLYNYIREPLYKTSEFIKSGAIMHYNLCSVTIELMLKCDGAGFYSVLCSATLSPGIIRH